MMQLKKMDSEELHKLESKIFYKFSGIGLIMDAITAVTDIIISTDYEGLVFKKDSELIKSYYDPNINFDQFYDRIKSLKLEIKISVHTNFYPKIGKI